MFAKYRYTYESHVQAKSMIRSGYESTVWRDTKNMSVTIAVRRGCEEHQCTREGEDHWCTRECEKQGLGVRVNRNAEPRFYMWR